MKKIAVLFADGTEEIEGLTPVDILRRSGAECDIVSVGGEFLTGSHNIIIKADKMVGEIDRTEYDAVVIPGGMPGATNIAKNNDAISLISYMVENNKLVASICASPAVVLATNGFLKNKKATCYPAKQFVDMMGENYTGADVELDENLITANGPISAFNFSLEIVKKLGLEIKF